MTPELSFDAKRWDTSRLTIRAMAVDDVSALQMFMLDARLYTFTGGCPSDVDALRQTVRRWVAGSPSLDARWFNWVVVDRACDEIIGTVQLTATYSADQRWDGEIAYIVAVAYQGLGYATEMASSLVDKMAAADFAHARAHVLPGHVASERVVQNAGFVPTGSFEDDEQLWMKALQ